MSKLKEKAVKLEEHYSGYAFEYQGLGLEDLDRPTLRSIRGILKGVDIGEYRDRHDRF